MVIADLLLVRVEPHALADERLVRFAACTPYCEGHLEADGEGTGFVEVARAGAERVLVVQLVAACEAFLVRGDISV